ncbi:prolyl 4-hydroxylase alpha-subunit [Aureococcus anophagefferens]|nr:prolyl 4-hydroxylase alpha-subunit [Aureococcus anophagefferens]
MYGLKKSDKKAAKIYKRAVKPERDLRGKVFAVDLSLWLVQAASSPLLKAQHKHPHLFLAYSRATFFLRLGAARRRRRRATRGSGGAAAATRRTEFGRARGPRRAGAACVAVLRALGTPVVFAGEAEATRGAGAAGLVDGVFTEDGDAFLCETAASEHTSNDEPPPLADGARPCRNIAIVVFTDAYDVFWNAPLPSNLLDDGVDVLFAGEPTCWPDPSLADRYPPCASPYRFVNSGCFVGRARALKALVARASARDDDQLLATLYYLRDPVRARVDSACSRWQCLGGVGTLGDGELAWAPGSDGRPALRNARHGTTPCAVHGNGDGELQAQWRALAAIHLREPG